VLQTFNLGASSGFSAIHAVLEKPMRNEHCLVIGEDKKLVTVMTKASASVESQTVFEVKP